MIPGSGNYLVDSADSLGWANRKNRKYEEEYECDECGCSMNRNEHEANSGLCIDCIHAI